MPPEWVHGSVIAAGVLFVSAPFLYRAKRLRLLLALVVPYVGACMVLLADAATAAPSLSAGASLLGSIPVAFLLIAVVDMRLGLFATETLWLVPFAIFALVALAPVSFVLHLGYGSAV